MEKNDEKNKMEETFKKNELIEHNIKVTQQN